MKKPNHQAIRQLLRQHPAGMLLACIASEVGAASADSVRSSLKSMPDAYIAHWVHTGGRGASAAVWRVVPVPPHCPRPAAMS